MKLENMIAVILSVLTLFWAAAADAAEAAMVSSLQGEAYVETEQGQRPVELLDTLPLSTRLTVAEDAVLELIYFSDGKGYRFHGQGTYRLADAAPEVVSAGSLELLQPLNGALADKKIRADRVSSASLWIRALDSQTVNTKQLQPVQPAGSLVLPETLTFSWQSLGDGVEYQIKILDLTGQTVLEQTVDGTVFTLPEQVQLQPDQLYLWDVSASLPDGRVLTSSENFTVAPVSLVEQARQLRPAAGAGQTEQVAYALWLQQHSLHAMAMQILQQVSSTR